MVMTGEATYKLELQFPVIFLGTDGEEYEFPTILDTGFTGRLSVPQELVEPLKLEAGEPDTVTLGDGSEVQTPTYFVNLLWEGKPRRVQAILAPGLPLMGLRLIQGMVAVLHVSDGGSAMLFRP